MAELSTIRGLHALDEILTDAERKRSFPGGSQRRYLRKFHEFLAQFAIKADFITRSPNAYSYANHGPVATWKFFLRPPLA